MAFFLTEPDLDISIELPMSDHIARVFELQCERLGNSQNRAEFSRRLSASLTSVLSDVLEWDLQPPTDRQIAFAVAISRQLAISIPKDVLQFKGEMQDFLEKYSPLVKNSRDN